MLDLRLPIGLFFVVTGVILVLANFTAGSARVGIPVDLDWGVLLLLFGAIMTVFGASARPLPDDEASNAAAGAPDTPDHSAEQAQARRGH